MLDWFGTIIYPILFIFPAYAANGIPVLLGSAWGPLDFGRKFRGIRILGDNKTIRGTTVAILAGLIAGYLESWALPGLLISFIAVTFGAVFGDLLGSFLKRQLKFKPGSSFPVMDQYGFFIFAMLFAYPFGNLPSLYGIIFLIVLTGIIHVGTNIGAYKMGLKKVPW
jgi:CDP-2,3-bis-(O-geranylgeranyl)-sn-glycerol synthase